MIDVMKTQKDNSQTHLTRIAAPLEAKAAQAAARCVHVHAGKRCGARWQQAALVASFLASVWLAGCGASGVVGEDGIETRTTESFVDGNPRRLERYRDDKLLDVVHLYRSGKIQHRMAMTENPEIAEVTVYFDDGKTPHLRYLLRRGQVEGNVVEHDRAGRPRFVRPHRDGKMHGTEQRIDEDKKVIATAEWVDGERDGPARTYYPTGEKETELVWKQGVPAGTGEAYHVSGKRKATFELLAGVRHGVEVQFDDNGGRAAQIHWRYGVLSGPYETYHANGKLATRVLFVNGRAEGLEAQFYSSGKPRFRVNRSADLRQGEADVFAPEGYLSAKLTYKDDVLVGVEQRFHPTGELSGEFPYVDGKLNGIAKLYYASGKKMAELPMKDGSAEGIERRYREDDGSLFAEIPRKGGLAQGNVKAYDREGSLIRYIAYDADLPHGRMVDIFPFAPGTKKAKRTAAEAFFERGKPVGVRRRWYTNAQLMETRPHDPVGSGPLRRWHENGQPQIVTELVNGAREGKEQVFSSDGRLWAERTYQADVLVGEERRYYRTGELMGLYPVGNGLWNGMAQIYAARGAYLWATRPYVDGKANGTETRFAKNGTKWALVFWKDDKEIGRRMLQKRRKPPKESDTWYFANSEIKRRELIAVADKEVKLERRYFETGAVQMEVPMRGKVWDGEATYFAPDGRVVAKVPFVEGKRSGREIRFYETGEKHMEIPFSDDRPTGVATTFYADGTVQSRFPADEKGGAGVEVQFHHNGQVRLTVPMVGGARHGVARLQGANGEDVLRLSYVRGEREGFEVYYHDNGRTRMVSPILGSQRDGIGVGYTREGKRWAEIPWVKQRKEGTERRFGPDGFEVVEEVVFKDGQAVETRTYVRGDEANGVKPAPAPTPPAPKP